MATNHFSRQLTLLLDRLGMTRYRLARMSGLSPSYVGLLASGARSPSDDALKKLAPILQVDLAELKAWVEAGRLGEEGLAGLRRHLEGPWPVAERLLPALTAYAGAESDEATLLSALGEALGAIGLALWQRRGAALQITSEAGLPSEYVTIANLRFKEQGLKRGALFPAIDAHLSGAPVTVTGLVEDAGHPLHFYARTLGFDTLHCQPLLREGAAVGVLAVYLAPNPPIGLEAMRPWLELAAALLAGAAASSRQG